MRQHRTAFNLLQLIALMALAAYLMVACGGSAAMRTFQGLAVTGEAIDDAGKHMQSVNALYVTKCKDRTLTAKQCNDFIDFGEKFKKVYPASVAMWKASRSVSDAALRKQTDEIIRTILSELISFGATVGYQVIFKSEKETPWLSLPS
ncbi:MAG TPA: hypothetical protein VJ816_08250 [Gemmatimonadales bacterium]|nr:hypothetical protein [Gemmatimonadales bacterium]